jgi:formate hydrogenlyase subunit 3/multisubunit Na+/H+ antiporter MnhD subunit
MAIIDINRNPSRRELAWFPWIFLLFCVLLGTMLSLSVGRRTWTPLWVAGGIGIAVCCIGVAAPVLRRPLFLAWSYVTLPLGFVMAYLSLGILYFLVITPIGLLVRVFSHDPMSRTLDQKAATYWVRRGPAPESGRYFRQY